MAANKNQRIATGAGALALLAGAVGPWATLLGAISNGPTSSTEVTHVVFGGIALLLLCALTGKGIRTSTIAVGSLALIEAGYAIVKIQDAKAEAGEWGALVSPGWGLYLTAVVAIFLIVSTWVVKRGDAPQLATV